MLCQVGLNYNDTLLLSLQWKSGIGKAGEIIIDLTHFAAYS